MSRSLDDLDQRMRPLADAFLSSCKAAGYEILVTSTLRTLDEQAKLYAIGRTVPGKRVTNAKPGSSAHNYGLAMDIAPMIHGKPYWNFTRVDPIWSQVGKLGQAAGLEWFGAPNSPYLEAAHFQIRNWKELL